jgi:hypothetical protein
MTTAKRRDIFDTGAPSKAPVDKSAADIPADAWVPRVPVIEGVVMTFDEAADEIQRVTSVNAARYIHELEMLATAWRGDVTLAGTSAKAAMHLLSLAAGAPEKRNKPAPKVSRRVDELRALLTGDDEGEA